MISKNSNLPNKFLFPFDGGHQITFSLAMTFNNFQICNNDVKVQYPITSVVSSAYPISFALWIFQTLLHI